MLILFGALWGGLLALFLCAPYGYYPLFFMILAISIVVFIVSKKAFKYKMPYLYSGAILVFFASYSLCSYIIFKPGDFHYSRGENLLKNRKAVIFYCEGEMEKYTPYYSNYFFKDVPVVLKPFYAMKIKDLYRSIGVNTKNQELLQTAKEVKNSLLNHGPYYFYICFEGYVPDIKDSIHSAISDGCSEITILNYTANLELENTVRRKINIEYLKSKNINVNFTNSVCTTEDFIKMFVSKIVNMPYTWDGIIILGEEGPGPIGIRDSLKNYGYDESQIFIGLDIDKSIKYFMDRKAKNILYVNTTETSSGIKADITIPRKFEKYGYAMKIKGLKSWGYDRRLVNASVKVLLDIQ